MHRMKLRTLVLGAGMLVIVAILAFMIVARGTGEPGSALAVGDPTQTPNPPGQLVGTNVVEKNKAATPPAARDVTGVNYTKESGKVIKVGDFIWYSKYPNTIWQVIGGTNAVDHPPAKQTPPKTPKPTPEKTPPVGVPIAQLQLKNMSVLNQCGDNFAVPGSPLADALYASTCPKPGDDGNVSGIFDIVIPGFSPDSNEAGPLQPGSTCNDSLDNDGDTLTDVQDPDCQDTNVEVRPQFGTKQDTGDIAIEYWQIGGVGGVKRGNVLPFGMVTLGATRFVVDTETISDDTWKFSMIFGFGAKVYMSDKIGLRFQGQFPISFTSGGLAVGTGGLGLFGTGITQFSVQAGLIIALGET